MALRILLVDDDPACLEGLTAALDTFSYVNVMGTAQSAGEAAGILQREAVDLVFLDIEMADVNGFELARHIQNAYPQVMIVFLTGHVDFALDGYEYKPLDFLIKPVNSLRLERVLLRAKKQLENTKISQESSVRIGLPVDGGLEIIEVNQLLYIEKDGRKVFLVCLGGERYRSYDTLQKLLGIFEPYGFFRCHQSFLVRLSAIKSIHLDPSKNSYNIQLNGTDVRIPLSRNKYNELKEMFRQRGMKIFGENGGWR